jgi:hypothetical protein
METNVPSIANEIRKDLTVWIATRCNNEGKLDLLIETVSSCLDLPSVKHVVVSVYTTVENFETTLKLLVPPEKRLTITKRSTDISDFEHYKLLITESDCDTGSLVTICQENDLLLPVIEIPYKFCPNGFLARQYVTVHKSNNLP